MDRKNRGLTGVTRGAALSKMPQQASVVASSATKHYGVEAWEPYSASVDNNMPTENWRDGSKRVARVWHLT